MKHVQEPVPLLRERNPDVSPACEALVVTMMAKSPADRQPSWEAVTADIRAVREGRPPRVAEAVTLGPLQPSGTARRGASRPRQDPSSPGSPGTRLTRRTWPLVLSLSVAAAVALVALYVTVFARKNDPRKDVLPRARTPAATPRSVGQTRTDSDEGAAQGKARVAAADPKPAAPHPLGAEPPTPPFGRPRLRYDGVFVVGLHSAVWGPPGDEPTAVATEDWRKSFLQTVKDLGFNTISGDVPDQVLTLAGRMRLHAVVGRGFDKALDTANLSVDQAWQAVSELAGHCRKHPHILAGFLYTDPVKQTWRKNWGVLGRVWNRLHPDVPLLATYHNAQMWRDFSDASPVRAVQAWCYVFRKGRTTAQALRAPVCIGPTCRGMRDVAAEAPVWPWMQGILGGWGLREPSLEETSAVYYSALTEGVRGAILFTFKPPGKDKRYLADSQHRPVGLLRDLGPVLRRFSAMGRALLPYRVDDALACSTNGSACIGAYVEKKGQAELLMLASKDVEREQDVRVQFAAGTPLPTRVRDALDGEEIAVDVTNGNAAFVAKVAAADGRLFEVVRSADPGPTDRR